LFSIEVEIGQFFSGTNTIVRSGGPIFEVKHVGRLIRVRGSSSNEGVFAITSLIDPNTVEVAATLTSEGPGLIGVTGLVGFPEKVRWQLREIQSSGSEVKVEVQEGDVSHIGPGWILRDGSGQFVVKSRRQLKVLSRSNQILTEKEGTDAYIDSDGYIRAPLARFAQIDVGKKITLAGSGVPENNNRFEIQHVLTVGGETIAVPSYKLIQGETFNGGVAYSSRGADLDGEPLRVRHLDGGLSAALSVSVDKGDITVTPATNAFGEVTSTASEVVAAVAADATASDMVKAQVTGDGSGRVGLRSFVYVTGRLLTPDTGPFFWAVLPRSQLTLQGKSHPKGLVEQNGFDLEVVASGVQSIVKTLKSELSAQDVGKILTVRGSLLGNDGFYPVVAVDDPSTMRVEGVLAAPDSELFWELRSKSSEQEDETLIVAHAPSMLQFLARDFGIEVDELQKESRRRSNVRDIWKWADIKGHPDSYRILGLIQGFDVAVEQLYSVSLDFFTGLGSSFQFPVGDEGEGRAGLDGQLQVGSGGRVRFYSPSAQFVSADVGRGIDLSNLTSPTLPVGHTGIFGIESFIDANTVEFRLVDSVLFDPLTLYPNAASNDDVQWYVYTSFTTQAPVLPTYDVFNSDALRTYVLNNPPAGDDITVDMFCSDPTWSSSMQTDVLSVVSPSVDRYTLTVSIVGSSVASWLPGAPSRAHADIAKIIVGLGVWKFTDSANLALPEDQRLSYFLETVPTKVLGDPTKAQFDVVGALPPSAGPGNIEYVCEPQFDLSCGYCASSTLLARVTGGTILSETGKALQDVYERLFDRLEEATPADVRLVRSLSVTLEASLNLQASGLSDVTVGGTSAMTGTGTVTPIVTGWAIGPKMLGTGTLTMDSTLWIIV
jgi:hypothetical protein